MSVSETYLSTTDRADSPGVSVAWAATTDVGLRRCHNEDSYIARFPLFVVADGMGGHEKGEVASARVVEAMDTNVPGDRFVDAVELSTALLRTTRSLSELGGNDGSPGSTMTGMVFSTHRDLPCARIFNIGDSRTYLLSSEGFSQVTIDHSEYQELRDAGMLSAADARSFSRRHVLTKALGAGFGPSVPVDQFIVPISAGDRYILCSDGLSGEVTDALIEMVARTLKDPQAVADELLAMALRAGGADNVTIIVLDIREAWPSWDNGQSVEPDDDALCIDGDTLPNDRVVLLRDYAQLLQDEIKRTDVAEGEL